MVVRGWWEGRVGSYGLIGMVSILQYKKVMEMNGRDSCTTN